MQSSCLFVRMIIPIKSTSISKLGHTASKTGWLVETIENHFVQSGGHSFDLKFMKLCQYLIFIKPRSRLKLGHVESKTRSLGQILKRTTCTIKRAQVCSQFHETLSEC